MAIIKCFGSNVFVKPSIKADQIYKGKITAKGQNFNGLEIGSVILYHEKDIVVEVEISGVQMHVVPKYKIFGIEYPDDSDQAMKEPAPHPMHEFKGYDF